MQSSSAHRWVATTRCAWHWDPASLSSTRQTEPHSRSVDNHVGRALNPQSLRIHTEIEVFVRAAVALPVQTHPLITLLVRVIDETSCFVGTYSFSLHCARDQRLPRCVAEHVQSVVARGKHFLRAAPYYN